MAINNYRFWMENAISKIFEKYYRNAKVPLQHLYIFKDLCKTF